MKNLTKMTIGLAVTLALGLVWAAPVALRSAPASPAEVALPVADYPAAIDVPGAHELPDPAMDYKVVFTVGQGAKDSTAEVNPMLPTLARYVNTLAKYGVPAEKRDIVVMFHQRSADFDIIMSNEAFKARHGKDNPNIELIHALKDAGVQFRACGQGLSARKIDASEVNPDIQVDLWAMTSIVNLQMRGFARVGS